MAFGITIDDFANGAPRMVVLLPWPFGIVMEDIAELAMSVMLVKQLEASVEVEFGNDAKRLIVVVLSWPLRVVIDGLLELAILVKLLYPPAPTSRAPFSSTLTASPEMSMDSSIAKTTVAVRVL